MLNAKYLIFDTPDGNTLKDSKFCVKVNLSTMFLIPRINTGNDVQQLHTDA